MRPFAAPIQGGRIHRVSRRTQAGRDRLPDPTALVASRFDGVRYGHRAARYRDLIDMYCRTRAEGFGAEVKRRILVGTYVLSHGYYDAYYVQAQKVRRLIAGDFARAFERCDVIMGPTS